MLFKKKPTQPLREEFYLTIQWGAYYVAKSDNGYTIFRLLDFNKDAYHIQAFTDTFDHVPTLDEVENLKPFIWHAPIAVGGFINNKEVRILGHKPLTDEDLQGYDEYHRQTGMSDTQTNELHARVIEMSKGTELDVAFVREGGRTVLLLGGTFFEV